MREIKFRAWDKTRSRISHVYTFYVELDGSIKHAAVDDRKESCDTLFEGELELMQYTGLKDKNGKEIYEGDIVNYRGEVSEIFWCDEMSSYGRRHNGANLFSYTPIIAEVSEIIGNIYENSDLLNSEQGAQECDASKA